MIWTPHTKQFVIIVGMLSLFCSKICEYLHNSGPHSIYTLAERHTDSTWWLGVPAPSNPSPGATLSSRRHCRLVEVRPFAKFAPLCPLDRIHWNGRPLQSASGAQWAACLARRYKSLAGSHQRSKSPDFSSHTHTQRYCPSVVAIPLQGPSFLRPLAR